MNKTDLERHLGVSRATLKKMIDGPPKVESCGIKGQHVLFDDDAIKELEKRNRGRARSLVKSVKKSDVAPDNSVDGHTAEIALLKEKLAGMTRERDNYLRLLEMAIGQKMAKAPITKPTEQKEIEKAAKDFVEKLRKKDAPNKAAQKSTPKKSEPTAPIKEILGVRQHSHYKQPILESAIRQVVAEILPNGIPARVEKEARAQILEELSQRGHQVTGKYLSDIIARVRKEAKTSGKIPVESLEEERIQ